MRNFKRLTYLFLTLVLGLLIVGCQKEATLKSIAIDESTIPTDKYASEIDLTTIKLIVTMSDGTTNEVFLQSSFISGSDLDALKVYGNHVITVYYKNLTTIFSIEIKKSNVEEVNEKINSLNTTITNESEALIIAARTAYDSLSDTEKQNITNYNKLLELENKLVIFKVVSKIDEISATITKSDKETIEEARTMYDALSSVDKANVTNYNKLTKAEADLDVVLLKEGVDINFNVNGGMWDLAYLSLFTPDYSFKATRLNSSTGGTWGDFLIISSKGHSSAPGLYWDRVYIKFDNNLKQYVITGLLTSGGKFDVTPEYEYIIGCHANCTDNVSESAINKAVNNASVGDIIMFDGFSLDSATAGAYDINITIYKEASLSSDLVFNLKEGDSLPTAISKYVTFNGWYTNEKCTGEAITAVSTKYDTLYAGWEEAIKIRQISVSNEVDEILRYETLQLKWEVIPANASVPNVIFRSSDENIIKVNSNGLITAVDEGTATISVISFINKSVEYVFDITVYTPGRIEATYKTSSVVEKNKTIEINAEYCGKSDANMIFTSSDTSIATVNANGVVTGVKEGTAIITISVGDVSFEAGVTVVNSISELDPVIQYLLSTTCYNPISMTATSYGAPAASGPENSTNPYYTDILGSINKFLFEDLDITEMIVPESHTNNRPGTIFKKEYICVHDTGTYTTALAANFASNMQSTSSETSWQYTVGNDGIFHTIPDNEKAYHAGDGSRVYGLDDTGIKATTLAEDAVITIDTDGYYQINGISTKLRPYNSNGSFDTTVYTTSQINGMGIRCVVGENGNYMLGKTWYSSSYGYIANYGGNSNSIGIESSVSIGTDYYYTWQKLAKLVAKLMLDNSLTINDVKGHNFFSGKPCPQVLLWNDLWDNFIEMVKTEYEMITTYKDYTVSLSYETNSSIDSNGRLNRTKMSGNVTYTITVTKASQTSTITLSSMVPGTYSL